MWVGKMSSKKAEVVPVQGKLFKNGKRIAFTGDVQGFDEQAKLGKKTRRGGVNTIQNKFRVGLWGSKKPTGSTKRG